MKQDLFQAPDYFNMDELLTDEHKLIRESAREWVKKAISPIIEEACQNSEFPKQCSRRKNSFVQNFGQCSFF